MQLDPGFTTQGFWAQVAVQAIAALLGTLGALLVAWFIFLRTSEKDRAALERQLAHDLEMRRQEDANRRLEHDEERREERRRLQIALLGECDVNVQAIDFMLINRPWRFPLRRAVLDVNLGDMSDLPVPVGESMQLSSLHIDQYNAVPEGDAAYITSLTIARDMIEDAAILLARFLKGEDATRALPTIDDKAER